MALVTTIDNEYQLKSIFSDYDRDYYSIDGYSFFIDYFSADDSSIELDVIGICCEFTEYGEYSSFGWGDFYSDFASELAEYTDGDDDSEIYADMFCEYLEDFCDVACFPLENGDVMIIR